MELEGVAVPHPGLDGVNPTTGAQFQHPFDRIAFSHTTLDLTLTLKGLEVSQSIMRPDAETHFPPQISPAPG
jgi:hypothetical protein